MNTDAVPSLMTIDDLCQALRVCRRTLDKMISAGQAPAPDVIVGARKRWRKVTVRRWIDGENGASATLSGHSADRPVFPESTEPAL